MLRIYTQKLLVEVLLNQNQSIVRCFIFNTIYTAIYDFVNIEQSLIAIAYAQLISYAIKIFIEIIIFSKLKVS